MSAAAYADCMRFAYGGIRGVGRAGSRPRVGPSRRLNRAPGGASRAPGGGLTPKCCVPTRGLTREAPGVPEGGGPWGYNLTHITSHVSYRCLSGGVVHCGGLRRTDHSSPKEIAARVMGPCLAHRVVDAAAAEQDDVASVESGLLTLTSAVSTTRDTVLGRSAASLGGHCGLRQRTDARRVRQSARK